MTALHEFIELLHRAWRVLRARWLSLLVCSLFFQVVAAVALAPAATWLTTRVISSTGRFAVGNTELVAFFLSPRGLLWLFLAGTAAVALAYAGHGGALLIAGAHRAGREMRATAALGGALRLLPDMVRLGGRHVAAHLLRLAPFAALAGLIYVVLLSSYDIYYLVSTTPPVWWVALGLMGVVLLGVVWVNGRLYIRWLLSLPALLYEGLPPAAALTRSAGLMTGKGWRLGGALLGLGLFLGLLPLGVTAFFGGAGDVLFAWLPANTRVVIPVLLLFGLLYVAVLSISAFLGVTLNSLVMAEVYFLAREAAGEPAEEAAAAAAAEPAVARVLTRRAWAAAGLALAVVMGGVGYRLAHMDLEDHILVTAHRGSSLTAPENTLSAIEQAIADGADYAEIDVQELGDGAIVMMHDTDFLRIAGLNKKVWEVTYDEVKDLDVGSWFDARFSGERLATLEQALAAAKGRIGLNIELKFHGHEKHFLQSVVAILEASGPAKDRFLASLDLVELLKVRELDPGIRLGAIVAKSIGRPEKLNVDLLSVSSGMASSDFIARAQRAGKEVHVWTVNDTREMARFIDLGVDSIITDDPAALRDLLRERAGLDDAARLVLRVRAWLWSD